MTERKHSELPWTVITDGETLKIKWFNGGSIANAMFTNLNRERLPAEANAAFIVTACNAHYNLVEALGNARLEIEYLHGKFQETGTGNATINQIDAALSKARGDA